MNVDFLSFTIASAMLLLPAPSAFAQRLSESTGRQFIQEQLYLLSRRYARERAPTEGTINKMPPERIYAADHHRLHEKQRR